MQLRKLKTVYHIPCDVALVERVDVKVDGNWYVLNQLSTADWYATPRKQDFVGVPCLFRFGKEPCNSYIELWPKPAKGWQMQVVILKREML